jgi:hypothetical protein
MTTRKAGTIRGTLVQPFHGTICRTTRQEIAREPAPILAFHWNGKVERGPSFPLERSTTTLKGGGWNGGTGGTLPAGQSAVSMRGLL